LLKNISVHVVKRDCWTLKKFKSKRYLLSFKETEKYRIDVLFAGRQ